MTTLAVPKNPSPPQVIALIERIQQVLATVEKPTEAAQLVKEADAIRYLAKKAECSTDVQNQAATVAILAKQRAGELLSKVELHRGGQPPKNRAHRDSGSKNGGTTLKELGVEKNDSKRWQTLAKVPRPEMERHINKVIKDGGEPTTSDAIRFVKDKEDKARLHKAHESVLRHEKAQSEVARNTRTREVKEWLDAIKALLDAAPAAVNAAAYGRFAAPETQRFVKRRHDAVREILTKIEAEFQAKAKGAA